MAMLWFLGLCSASAAPQNIEDFGAIPNDDSHAQALRNGKALVDALTAANTSARLDDSRTVLIPAGKTFWMLPVVNTVPGIRNVVIEIEGIISALTANITAWPAYPNVYTLVALSRCTNVTVISKTGSGVIEGNGHGWWWDVILSGADHRPNLLDMDGCQDVRIENLHVRNSPQYHLNLRDMKNVFITKLNVHVDLNAQKEMFRKRGLLSDGKNGIPADVPTFPLNTDGIDISGVNTTITDCHIECYDDAVAVKPLHKGSSIFGNDCTQNINILHSTVVLSVGMSIGSVPPNANLNCIKDVIVRNVNFITPIKAIYIKPNPGNTGSGLIANILYENIEMFAPIWWAIYVGTQQQSQPGNGTHTGCSFFYPLPNTTCPTNPLVSVRNITLRKVNVFDAELSPGVMIANISNPATGFVFDRVRFTNYSSWPVEGYFCEQVQGVSIDSDPVPPCLKNMTRDEFERYNAESGSV